MLDHERLDVYHQAIALLDQLDQIQEQIPAGRAHLVTQLDRAGSSIVLNIAEGAGEFSPDEKSRFYRMARRSAIEVAAILDILERRKSVPSEQLQSTKANVVRVVCMLVKLITRRGMGTGTGTGRG